jgi:hypothetical protein
MAWPFVTCSGLAHGCLGHSMLGGTSGGSSGLISLRSAHPTSSEDHHQAARPPANRWPVFPERNAGTGCEDVEDTPAKSLRIGHSGRLSPRQA